MNRKQTWAILGASVIVFLGIVACSRPNEAAIELKHYPLDNLENVVVPSVGVLDEEITSDGKGAFKVLTTKPTVLKLFEVNDIDIEDAQLIYQARLKTEGVEGTVYLEMWCIFAEEGEFFSRGLQDPLSGSGDWTLRETPFFLQKGQNPDSVRLNVVIDGKGTVWVDEVRLLKAPLP
jgi:hypothetical protein